MRKTSYILAAFVVVTGAAACKELAPEKSSDPSPAAPKDDENEPTDPPAEVSGAFLTKCAKDAFGAEAEGELQAYCILKNDKGERVDVTLAGVDATVTTADGKALPVAAPRPTGAGSPWHFGFDLPVRPSQVAKIDFTYHYDTAAAASAPANGEVTDLAYDWAHDPVFLPLIKAFTAGTHPLAFPTGATHLIFATDAVYKGDFGAANADKICQDAGAKVDANRTWIALLSTSTQNAYDKAVLRGKVYNLLGESVMSLFEQGAEPLTAKGVQPFWNEGHGAPVRYTETGRSIAMVDGNLDPPRFVPHVWTGSDPAGKYDATGGACADWSRADGDATGVIGRGDTNAVTVWLSLRPDNCDELARLMCLSL